jgi:hypothetical protein
MTSDAYPYRASCDNEGVVQLERPDGRPSASSQPYESRSVFTPGKVVQPMLAARMKKRDLLSRFRVYCVGPGLFITIARRTRQTQILLCRWPITGAGDNVIYFALDATEPL